MRSATAPFHLLLVEDEHADAELFTELIGEISRDIQIHHVLNGQEALEFVTRQGRYVQAPFTNLIVLDLNMPVMNGHEFLKRAKREDRARSIPVLVLSTSDHPRDITRAYHEYASSYVVKPGSFAEYRDLLTVIEGYWRGAVKLPTVEQISAAQSSAARSNG
ncbi:response regulator [Deinococcus sp.]|uniref:response regulator n=1 Tax=Deinococcus sp. TaxID=47478 RepID=UPI003C79FFBC